MASSPVASRSSKVVRHRSIVHDFRRMIVKGDWPLGERLPTRDVLAGQYQTSKLTVQKALDRLHEEGLVEPRGRAGTFVSSRKPTSATYGLVFSEPLSDSVWSWSPYWNALRREADLFSTHRAGQRVECFFNCVDPLHEGDTSGLSVALDEDRLAGLIVVDPKHWNPSGPVALPTVYIAGRADNQQPSVTLSTESWIERATEELLRLGRRRVALMNNAARSAENVQMMVRKLVNSGMTVRPQWVQGIYANEAHWARNCAHLLAQRQVAEPIDALLITDDSLVEHAVGGLVDARVGVPDDIHVIAHCNFPWPTPSALKVRRLGHDLRQLLLSSVAVLDRVACGQRVKPVTVLPVLFENELVHASIAGPSAVAV
jgi:DNA-binding LacI/PurR family transcriptional regulator